MPETVIRVCGSITPRELVARHQNGCTVYRTAHIGNQYLSNLALAALGLPLCLYDKTMPSRDVNYHPATRIAQGKQEMIVSPEQAAADILVPFMEFPVNSPLREWHTPAHFHFRTLKEVFTGPITTEAELFLRHEDQLRYVLSVVDAHTSAVSFDGTLAINRYVLDCGCMVPLKSITDKMLIARCPHDRKEIPRNTLVDQAISLLHTLRDLVFDPVHVQRRGGAVPSLALAQAMFTLVGWWESGHAEIFELSGPDFIKYGPSAAFVRQVKTVFQMIERYAPSRVYLPPTLTLSIVPTADFRFCYIEKDWKSALVLQLHESVLQLQRGKRKAMREQEDQGNRMLAAGEFDVPLKELMARLKEYRSHWDIFYDINAGLFFSHHDMVPGSKLVVPDSFLDMPFAAMYGMVQQLQAIAGK